VSLQLGEKLQRTFFIDSGEPLELILWKWSEFRNEIHARLDDVARLQGVPLPDATALGLGAS
jgi:hypothetical protein